MFFNNDFVDIISVKEQMDENTINIENTPCGEVAIRVKNLSKCYQVYARPQDRLKQSIHTQFSKIIGKKSKQYYQEFRALNDLSFDINKGETVGIVGKNGSGKSTLLQVITGTLSPSSGIVEVNGRLAALLELGSGFNPEFTGRENVYLNGAILGLSEREIEKKLDEILSFADIGDFIDQPVKTYSSGMYVRLAFSIQANVDPEVLIVDEALAVGDAYFVHRCMLRFRELQAQGVTILFVSHDANSVRNLCHRAIWIDGGGIKKDGNSSSVVDSYLAHLFGRTEVISQKDNIHITKSAYGNSDCKERPIETKIPNIDRRLGDQSCSIVGVGIYDEAMNPISTIRNDSVVILRITIINNSLAKNIPLVVGYVFRNAKGQEIASTNSSVEGITIGSCEGETLMTVAMHIDIPRLHPGSYAFSPTIGYSDGAGDIALGDRIENAVVFQITSDVPVHVLMNLHTTMTVEG